MFWSSSIRDLNVIIFLVIVAMIISIFVYFKTKNKFASLVIFSILGNLIFWDNSGSRLLNIPDFKWVVKFTLWYWPWINVGLLAILAVNYFRNKGKNQNLG
ncbi:MAG TPA: hypothetical protein P5262_04305 [Candidatus Moranbacteria bacterium]|nr:hypothetical protein [Candidatus Moranbacteria bacterium]